MDARGRLDPLEREAIASALRWLGPDPVRSTMDRDDLRQLAHIALWRTQGKRRPGRIGDAVRVCKNALVDAVRAEFGRASSARAQAVVLPYIVDDDDRLHFDDPLGILIALETCKEHASWQLTPNS